MEHAFEKAEAIVGNMKPELKREIRDGVADLVSLLNELMRMSEIS